MCYKTNRKQITYFSLVIKLLSRYMFSFFFVGFGKIKETSYSLFGVSFNLLNYDF